MPKQYEAIRDKFISEGMDTKEAKTRAAKIYNSKHHDNPVGRYSDKPSALADRVKAKKK
jgi:hypothetical protein